MTLAMEKQSVTFDSRISMVGQDQTVPVLNGQRVRYVNLDNAASTPAFSEVMDALRRFMPYYSSVHRGTGFKSRISTRAYDQAHDIIARFVGADPRTNAIIFGKNATEAINKLSYRLPIRDDAVVLSTQMEHHSNDLPWRRRTRVIHIPTTSTGRLDMEDLERQLTKYAGRLALLAVTGASNVSGYVQPVHKMARMAHEAGAQILVDAAQLAPHRKVDMRPDDDPEHLDYVVLSAHKMYAPFGTGALIGPKKTFLASEPEYQGGGTVDIVTLDNVYWAGLPDRDEAGSPNVVGAVAMAVAAQKLMALGMENVAKHEADLVTYASQRLKSVKGLRIYGEQNPDVSTKVGVIPFNLEGISHFLVAAVLGYEGGVGVRSGCFCAHPYVINLLNLSEEESSSWRDRIIKGDRSQLPGLVRASFGCYNSKDDIDVLVETLERISRNEYEGDYEQITSTGEYLPRGYEDPLSEHYLLES